MSKFRIFLFTLYLVSAVAYGYLVWNGWAYYRTPIKERPHHQAYRMLKPGGSYGHGYGVVGSIMMLIMLLYSARKRVKFFSRLGPITHWLDLHIYLGIMGPLLIILHSTLKIHGLVAVSFYSMVAVALSGILGRYLYLQIPRNLKGQEMTMKEIEEMDRKLSTQLKQEFHFTDEMIAEIEDMTKGAELNKKNAFSFLVSMIASDVSRWARMNKFKKYAAELNIPHDHLKAMIKIARRKAIIHRRILVLNKIHQMFHYWHVIHKPFAVVMIIIMFIHIAVAVTFGYRWIF